MRTKELLEKAIAIAVEAHRGQRDRYGGPYILHPLRVMARVAGDKEKIVAILHDVVEDTAWTFQGLAEAGFDEETIEAVRAVTKGENEPYEDYIKRAALSPIGRTVKLADLEDNMDVRRMEAVRKKESERLAKYLRAWRSLKGFCPPPQQQPRPSPRLKGSSFREC